MANNSNQGTIIVFGLPVHVVLLKHSAFWFTACPSAQSFGTAAASDPAQPDALAGLVVPFQPRYVCCLTVQAKSCSCDMKMSAYQSHVWQSRIMQLLLMTGVQLPSAHALCRACQAASRRPLLASGPCCTLRRWQQSAAAALPDIRTELDEHLADTDAALATPAAALELVSWALRRAEALGQVRALTLVTLTLPIAFKVRARSAPAAHQQRLYALD